MKIININLGKDLKELRIIPISDVHIGDKLTNYKLFKQVIETIKEFVGEEFTLDEYYETTNWEMSFNIFKTKVQLEEKNKYYIREITLQELCEIASNGNDARNIEYLVQDDKILEKVILETTYRFK